jgi:hypothetical protein
MAQDSLIGLTPEQYLAVSDAKAVALTQLANDRHKREERYANLATVCGTISFLACIGAFIYLSIEGHRLEAMVVLGTAVLSIISQLIRARL